MHLKNLVLRAWWDGSDSTRQNSPIKFPKVQFGIQAVRKL